MTKKNTNKSFKLVSAILALVLWGSWAYLVNRNIVSAIVQGIASFIITLILIYCVTWFYNILPKTSLRSILPTLLTVSCTASALVVIHSLAGTQRIFYTVLPPIIVSTIFCLFVTFKLEKHKS